MRLELLTICVSVDEDAIGREHLLPMQDKVIRGGVLHTLYIRKNVEDQSLQK